MLAEYIFEVIVDNIPQLIKVIAPDKEKALEKINSFYSSEPKLIDIRSITF